MLELCQRRSVPSRLLADPGPDPAELLSLLALASRVPDHGALTPWRFLRIDRNSGARLGELLAQRKLELEPGSDGAAIEKERGRFLKAPVVIAVIGCYQDPHRIPLVEQQMSAGCVCFNLLQAAQAAGYGAQWLTGWGAYDPVIREALGVRDNEAVVGFIHIGTAREQLPERPRPDPADRLTDWVP